MSEITLNLNRWKDVLTGDEGWKQLHQHLLNDVLEAEMTEPVGAARYERSEQRKTSRNGRRSRLLNTRVGTVALQVPQSRDGSFSTELFCRYQRSEQALVLAMMEVVLQGVSTRKVKKITEALCGTHFSKSTESRLCAQRTSVLRPSRSVHWRRWRIRSWWWMRWWSRYVRGTRCVR